MPFNPPETTLPKMMMGQTMPNWVDSLSKSMTRQGDDLNQKKRRNEDCLTSTAAASSQKVLNLRPPLYNRDLKRVMKGKTLG